MELYARVRRAVVVDRMSEREAARQFGLARETVRKMLQYSIPPGYRRQQPVRRPKLNAWIGIKAHYFVMDLPQSDDYFVMAFPAETTEAFLEGHNDAFIYFGGIPRTIVYDSTKLAVAQILGDGERKKT